ncbi:hypothetical protein F5Y06DRAFT_306040 [Hypoxylon sp. FL0890]|nr:hypothetical protein F5Y06DRAFT_306040 [Hypoxylon sp. FL0890]
MSSKAVQPYEKRVFCINLRNQTIFRVRLQRAQEVRNRRRSLPARVLDVGIGTEPTDPVRLLSTEKGQDTYACLSHCWGKPKEGQPEPIIPIKQKESSFKRGIELNNLPKNYQDAIHFCRLLEIRYLWIDGLRIIQDSADDWACESLKMGSYSVWERDEDSNIRLRLLGNVGVETAYLLLKRMKPAVKVPVFERVGWAEYTGFDCDKVSDMSNARDTKLMI